MLCDPGETASDSKNDVCHYVYVDSVGIMSPSGKMVAVSLTDSMSCMGRVGLATHDRATNFSAVHFRVRARRGKEAEQGEPEEEVVSTISAHHRGLAES